MKNEDIFDALGSIRDCYIEEALKKKRKPVWLKAMAAAACALLIICAVWIWKQSKNPSSEGSGVYATKDGIVIPPLKVSLSAEENASMSMVGFLIYEGRCYVADERLADKKALKGEYLGTSNGLIDEWTPKEGYVDYAGSVKGDFFAVSGYDPVFMICMERETGELLILVNNNDLVLKKGSELFEDRLHLSNFDYVQYQSREDWYYGRGNIRSYGASYDTVLADFTAALGDADFMRIEDIPLEDGQDNVYDSKEICHLYFQMADGMTVHLRCFEGGYVRYSGIMDVCVRIGEDVFAAICGAFDDMP